MSEQLPEAVERVLQQFEAMAGAADWYLDGCESLRERAGERCPIQWLDGNNVAQTTAPGNRLGLSDSEVWDIAYAADDLCDRVVRRKQIRARLLAAAGLA